MRRRLERWELIGFGLTCLLGTAGHFLYDLSGGSPLAAAVSAVNESTWEHMKLLYLPWFLYLLIECFSLARELENFLAAKALGALAGLLAIPTLFYTLSGSLGKLPDAVNIGIFFVSAAAAYLVSCTAMKRGWLGGAILQGAGFLLLWGLLFLFVRWSFAPPHLPLFQDPLTLGYGVVAS